jgi:hypothetical protein
VFSHEHNYHHPQEESFPEEHIPPTLSTESSYWIIEDQAFSTSYDSAPSPSSPPRLRSATKSKTEKEKQLADERGKKREEEGAKAYDNEKALYSIIR